ncbi:arylesterase [Parathalassolituus penaei]|uniref:Arylesterase n=1 Tax=Parathalassolituus penaei TaxID=2997323 RepID=A0A9X3EI91_9GAMM|nr:arylesterase [Parathalassolituus penaei]MCY0967234.1 arylesterase [Parathalassolituus penaei]
MSVNTHPQRQTFFMALFTLMVLLWMAASQASTPARTILVVGDSISAGFGIPVQQGWVVLLREQLQQPVPGLLVQNASISGDTTQGGVARLPALLQQHQPALVMIELGGNDALRGTPLALIRRNLETMIQQAQAAGANVMLLGMKIPPNYGQKYADGFAELYTSLANQYQLALVPFLLDEVALKPGLMQADGIHPTAEAQPQLVANVMTVLQPLLGRFFHP